MGHNTRTAPAHSVLIINIYIMTTYAIRWTAPILATRTAGYRRSWARSARIPKFSTGATGTAAGIVLAMASLATDVTSLRRPFEMY